MITGNTVQERKKVLADLACSHLNSIGIKAKVVHYRKNTAGHSDQVVIESDKGLIQVTATESTEPNASIATAGYIDGNQNFLADKDYVVYGWNTKDKRTMLMFVDAKDVDGKKALTKDEIRKINIRELSTVLK